MVAGMPSSEKFCCKIIFVLNIFVHFLCTKIFCNKKNVNYGTFIVGQIKNKLEVTGKCLVKRDERSPPQ